jgi:hypothetical protein
MEDGLRINSSLTLRMMAIIYIYKLLIPNKYHTMKQKQKKLRYDFNLIHY